MSKLIYFVRFLLLVELSACRPSSSPPALISTDFDSLVGWVADGSTLRTEQAHSGEFAVRVDADHEFGITCERVLGEASPHRLRGVHIEAWGYRTADAGGARLGIVVTDPITGASIVSDGVDLKKQLAKEGMWQPIKQDISFPPTVQYQHHLKCFLWRADAPAPVYLDDLTVTALY